MDDDNMANEHEDPETKDLDIGELDESEDDFYKQAKKTELSNFQPKQKPKSELQLCLSCLKLKQMVDDISHYQASRSTYCGQQILGSYLHSSYLYV